ncbi:MAG: beta-alanyl-CoA:ammonia lyase [Lachnospiraceae bacterium]
MSVRKNAFLSYNMTTADANNPEGVVPFGRQFDFIGDVETELMILNDGDESLCLGYTDVELYEDVYVGDMIDVTAEMIKVGNTSRTCKIRTYKVATLASRLDASNAKPNEMHYFEEPKLITEGTVVLVVKKELQRGEQPSGIVEDPWREIQY